MLGSPKDHSHCVVLGSQGPAEMGFSALGDWEQERHVETWAGQLSGWGQTKVSGAELTYADHALSLSFSRVGTVITAAAG